MPLSLPPNEAERRNVRRLHRELLADASDAHQAGLVPQPLAQWQNQAAPAHALAIATLSAEARPQELRRVVSVACMAQAVFGSAELACRWLCEPKTRLRGQTPLRRATQARHYRAIERWLLQIEEGGAA